MSFTLTDGHVREFDRNGYTIFRGLVPPALVTELRVMAEEARELAHQRIGPQAQRLQPVQEFLDIASYRELLDLPELGEAVERIFGEGFSLGWQPGAGEAKSLLGILFEPAESPYCTNWHRDWRDNIPGLDIDDWLVRRDDLRFFNQINCALYEDCCTWVVPGSHRRTDTPEEAERFPDRPIRPPDLEGLTPAEAERCCLDSCRSMPGATCACLDAGDFMLYRNTVWHIGTYVPYKKRATLHDQVWTPAFTEWSTNWPRRPDGSNEWMNPNPARNRQVS
jgi:hypothetical protein